MLIIANERQTQKRPTAEADAPHLHDFGLDLKPSFLWEINLDFAMTSAVDTVDAGYLNLQLRDT